MTMEGKLRLMVALAAASLMANAIPAKTVRLAGLAVLFGALLAAARSIFRQTRRLRERGEELEGRREGLESEANRRIAQLQSLNSRLETASGSAEMFLACVPSVLIGLDADGRITRWNAAATTTFGVDADRAAGQTLADCGIRWRQAGAAAQIAAWLASAGPSQRSADIPFERGHQLRLLGLHIRRILAPDGATSFIVIGADITERRALEQELQQAQRMESAGQLAAGIAHEINTPIQYLGDNMRFLREAFEGWRSVLGQYEQVRRAAESGVNPREGLAALGQAIEDADLDYLKKEIPKAIAQSLDGVERVATIVRAMKEFAHPGDKEKAAADLNRALSNTLIVARSELKHVAEVETDFGDLPPVVCRVAEMNQVFLNLLVNAAHAIGEVVKDSRARGKITVRTRREGDRAIIAISDTGCGIPASSRSRIFDPFFTTKPVGRGTGQGLSIARSIVVDKHGGSLTFEPNGSQGTTFVVSVPLVPAPAPAA